VKSSTITPQAVGVEPIFPAPLWEERIFTPDGAFEGKHRDVNIAIVVATTFTLAYGVFWLIWTLMVSKHAVVRAATPSFCYIVIIGNLIMASSNYAALYTSHEHSGDCVAAPWLLTLGFTLAYSSLFAKTFRIWRIFQVNSGKLVVVSMTTSLLVRIVGFWLLLDLIINIVWTSTSGMPMTLRVPDPYRINNNFYECDYSDSRPFILAHVAIKALLLFIGVALTIGVRNVPSAFNESTYMAVLIYNTAVLFAFILPIVSFQVGGREGTAIIRAFAILFISLFNITILFAPKLLMVKSKNDDAYRVQTANSLLSSSDETGTVATGQSKAPNTHTPMGFSKKALTINTNIRRSSGVSGVLTDSKPGTPQAFTRETPSPHLPGREMTSMMSSGSPASSHQKRVASALTPARLSSLRQSGPNSSLLTSATSNPPASPVVLSPLAEQRQVEVTSEVTSALSGAHINSTTEDNNTTEKETSNNVQVPNVVPHTAEA